MVSKCASQDSLDRDEVLVRNFGCLESPWTYSTLVYEFAFFMERVDVSRDRVQSSETPITAQLRTLERLGHPRNE